MLSTSRAFQLRRMRSPAPANDCEIPAAALFMVDLALKLQPHAVQRRREWTTAAMVAVRTALVASPLLPAGRLVRCHMRDWQTFAHVVVWGVSSRRKSAGVSCL